MAYVLSAAIDVSEFTRQLATPTVPKFSAALLALAQKPDTPNELVVCALIIYVIQQALTLSSSIDP